MELLTKLFRSRYSRWGVVCFLICFLLFSGLFSNAVAGPEGAQVVNGKVSIQQSGSNTAITASDKAIINYSSFNIAQPETVRFIQPGSSASVLNRILSANPTNINGTLLANGRVFFVNPAGVYIGAGARINVNQLVASGLNITNSDFINGRYNFVGGNGAVINSGDIRAEQVYLIGKQVVNSGNISCPAGYVVMASGDRVFLGEPGSDIVLEVDASSLSEPADADGTGAAVLNEGTIEASGGIIALAAAGDIYSQAISNVGTISASTDTGKAGQINLTAADGTVTNTGTIEATGGEGGQVAMEGSRVGQFGTINADGTSGDGGNVDLWASDVVALSPGSLTTANAGTDGDGGEVIVFSPDSALLWADALIEAKGGSESGDGGFVEISGIEYVMVNGTVDRRATHGEAGLLYIDPTDLTINDAGTDDTLWTGDAWADDVGKATSLIDIDTLETHIASGNTSIDATAGGGGGSGNISVNAGRDIVDGGSGNSLSLTGADITFTSGVNFSSTGNLDVLASGAVDIDSSINLTGGNFTSTGTTFDNTGGVITTTGGAVDIQNTGNVTIGANINAAGGAVSIDGGDGAGGSTATSMIDGGGTIISSNTISLEASGSIGAAGAGNAIDIAGTGTIDARSTVAGDIYIDNTGAVTLGTVSTTSSDIVINNTGDLLINSITAGGGGNVSVTATNIDATAVDPGDEIDVDGDLSLTAASIGGTAIIDITGDGSTDSTLTINSNGDGNVDLDINSDLFNVVDITIAGVTNDTFDIEWAADDIDLDTDGTALTVTSIDTSAFDPDVTITQSDGDVIFASIDTGTGNLSVTATAGNITDSGTVTVGGDASFTTSADDATIDLGTLDVAGSILLNTDDTNDDDNGHATIVNATGVDLGVSNVGGNLDVTANTGNITDSGIVTVVSMQLV